MAPKGGTIEISTQPVVSGENFPASEKGQRENIKETVRLAFKEKQRVDVSAAQVTRANDGGDQRYGRRP